MTTASARERIDTRFVPRFRAEVIAVPIEEEAVLYEEDTGGLHRLDPVALTVCALFDGQRPLEVVIDELVAAYGAPKRVVEADVLALARELADKGLFSGIGPGEAHTARADVADDAC